MRLKVALLCGCVGICVSVGASAGRGAPCGALLTWRRAPRACLRRACAGRSWLDPPRDKHKENDVCFTPKRWIHTWSGHSKVSSSRQVGGARWDCWVSSGTEAPTPAPPPTHPA